jgi:hypothetical protein
VERGVRSASTRGRGQPSPRRGPPHAEEVPNARAARGRDPTLPSLAGSRVLPGTIWGRGAQLTTRFAEGANYSIDLVGLTAVCRVWSRPDLDSAAGAQLAAEKVSSFQALARGKNLGMIFDLSLAPAVTGPKTQQALGEMLKAWEDANKPIALVAGSNPVQQLQLRRLISTFATSRGALFASVDEASTWLAARLPKG